jgi:hypothetical protein
LVGTASCFRMHAIGAVRDGGVLMMLAKTFATRAAI